MTRPLIGVAAILLLLSGACYVWLTSFTRPPEGWREIESGMTLAEVGKHVRTDGVGYENWATLYRCQKCGWRRWSLYLTIDSEGKVATKTIRYVDPPGQLRDWLQVRFDGWN